jgi:glycosyltransferase involved in cell wall biosynthesis
VRQATISVVVPAKNEERNIAWVLRRIPDYVHEVILVDGHSTDRTVEVAREIMPDIRVVIESARGKGSALRTGFAHASGDIIVMLDADGSMDPGEIERYVAPLLDGADVVKGSRYLPGGGTADITALRQMGNRVLLALVNTLYGSRFSELCYGYMALRRDRVEVLQLAASGFEIETEIVVRALRENLAVVEVPSFEAERRYGASNLNTVRDGFRVLNTLLSHRLRPATGHAASLGVGWVNEENLATSVSVATEPRLQDLPIEFDAGLTTFAPAPVAIPVMAFDEQTTIGEASSLVRSN